MRTTSSGIAWVFGVVLPTAVALAQATRPADPPVAAPSPAAEIINPPATQPTTAPSDPQSLARQLSDPNWQLRRSAREAFVRMGDEARPTLEALVQNARDEETRLQAREALAQIEENRTLGPSYITLHVKAARPDEVFAEISRQCHAPLATYPENLWSQGNFRPLTLDVDRKPFWEVMPQLCQHFGVEFTQFQMGLRIMRGANRISGITQVEGPFLVVANQLTYTRTRNLAQGRGDNSSFSMSLYVYPEPKITLMRGTTSLKLIDAADEHGNSLMPPVNTRSIMSGGFGSGVVQLYAPLSYPRRNPGSKMVRFRASVTFNVQTKSQQVQIGDVMKAKDQHVSLKGMDVTLKEVTQKPEGFEMKLVVVTSPLAPPELRNIYDQVQNNLHLLDERGQELPHSGISSTPIQDGAQINLQFMSGVPGRTPDKMLWEVPTEFRQVVVPIHFNDVPLFDN